MATAVGTGLDNLGSLCSQTGLDRWELLGIAVLSAITVYRKELSSNSVYHGGKKNSSGRRAVAGTGQADRGAGTPVFQHSEGCLATGADGGGGHVPRSGGSSCACMQGAQKRAAAAAAAGTSDGGARASKVDRRRLRRLVEGRVRSLNLPVNHLQQLRASVDASWSSFATAWETKCARGVVSGVRRKSGEGPAPSPGIAAQGSNSAGVVEFVMPPCSHASHRASSQGCNRRGWTSGQAFRGGRAHAACVECAALAAVHASSARIVGNGDGKVGRVDSSDVWASSALGALPEDAVQNTLGFLHPQDLLALAQVSMGAQKAAEDDLVWREAWLARFGALWESGICKGAAERWHLHGWNPRHSSVPQVRLG